MLEFMRYKLYLNKNYYFYKCEDFSHTKTKRIHYQGSQKYFKEIIQMERKRYQMEIRIIKTNELIRYIDKNMGKHIFPIVYISLKITD